MTEANAETNIFMVLDNPARNRKMQDEIKRLTSGESKTYLRTQFRDSCDEQDRVIYLSVARVLADRFGCELLVEEDDLVFHKP